MIRVLVVDDSALVRRVLSDELSSLPDIEVVGTAIDPYAAREQIAALNPDVLTLDIEMPRMDGLSFLAKLMKHHPMPVIIVSSLTPKDSEAAMRALQLGALDIVPKPSSQFSVPDVRRDLGRAIRAAARARVHRRMPPPEVTPSLAPLLDGLQTTHQVLAIGASTGGTRAIEEVLMGLPANVPGTLIVQHMPAGFTASFAERLNQVCPMTVREAKHNDPVTPGVALLAPGGDTHMLLRRSGARYVVSLRAGPPVNRHRPSVDVLFRSVAEHAGSNAVGVILTGMGEDGAKGMLELRESMAHTIAQDEPSSVVYGMPKVAAEMGGAVEIAPLNRISDRVLEALAKAAAPAATLANV